MPHSSLSRPSFGQSIFYRLGVTTVDGLIAFALQTAVIYYFSLALVVAYVWRIGIFPYDFFGYWHTLVGMVLNATFIAWLTLTSLFFFYPAFWYTARWLSHHGFPDRKYLRAWLVFGVPFWVAAVAYRVWNQYWLGHFKADFYLGLALAWAAFAALYVYGSAKDRRQGSLAAIFLFLPFYLSDQEASTYAVERLLLQVGLGGRVHVTVVPQEATGKADFLRGSLLLLGPEQVYIDSNGLKIVVPRQNTRRIEFQ